MRPVAALVGPTASGKTEVAVALGERFGAAVVSVDSMQVYRGMDIGTAKASVEQRARVPHHMIDIADPSEEFTVADFQAVGRRVLGELDQSGRPALIVGGSGLHFRALVDPLEFPPTDPGTRRRLAGLDPAAAAARLVAADAEAPDHVDMANPRRVVRALEVFELTGATPSQRAQTPSAVALREYRSDRPVIALGFDPGPALAERVGARCAAMADAGLLDEVAALAERLGSTARQAVGYKELLAVIAGRRDVEEAWSEVERSTMGLAKRQRTYFGRDPRIRWLPWTDDPAARSEAALAALEEAAWTS